MDNFNALAMQTMTQRNFQIDCLGETIITGYDSGDTWNGWKCPLFSFEQGQMLVDEWKKLGWTSHYDEEADAFVFSVNQDFETGESDEFDTFASIVREGISLYPIGSGSWMWEEEDEIQVGN